MYLTIRSVWLVALGVVAIMVAPRITTVLVWTGSSLLLTAVDALLAPSPRTAALTRGLPGPVRLGETTTADLTVRNPGRRTLRLQVRDAWPPSAQATGERSEMVVPAGQQRRTRTRLSPTRRGDALADLVTLRSRGPLGLAGRQASRRCPGRIRVLPSFHSRRHLPSRMARLREMDGRSAVLVRGAGTEFDSLRSYVIGDDVRSIDWRSTARRGDVVVRTWRPERDRRVLIVIDTGRMSAAKLGDEPRLDAQIEACLLLSALAARAGDRVDVIALDDRIRAQVRGQAGPSLLPGLADALAPLEAALTETDWTLLASTVHRVLSQRALVVVLTGLDGAGTDAAMLGALGSLAREHVILVASAHDPELARMRADRTDTGAVYSAAAAERDLVALDALRALLRRGGVEVVEAEASALAPALADAYLALKSAGRL